MANFFEITEADIANNEEYLSNDFIFPNIGFPNIQNYKNVEISYLPFEAYSYAVDDESVIYKLNNHCFRSDNFTSNHNGKKHALFAGCSETFGVAAEDGTVWTNYLYDMINQNNEFSGYFSMGHPGQGIEVFIHNILVYIEKYGTPDYIFMWLPNIERNIKFFEDRYRTMLPMPHREHNFDDINGTDDDKVENFKKDKLMSQIFSKNEKYAKSKFFPNKTWGSNGFVWDQINGEIYDRSKLVESVTKEEYLTILFRFKEQMVILEKLCKEKNIKLFWQMNRSLEEKYLLWINSFNNLVLVGQDNSLDKFFEKNINDLESKHYLVRRDHMHLGSGIHKFRAEKFFEAYSDNI